MSAVDSGAQKEVAETDSEGWANNLMGLADVLATANGTGASTSAGVVVHARHGLGGQMRAVLLAAAWKTSTHQSPGRPEER
jgi:hypothetical protein